MGDDAVHQSRVFLKDASPHGFPLGQIGLLLHIPVGSFHNLCGCTRAMTGNSLRDIANIQNPQAVEWRARSAPGYKGSSTYLGANVSQLATPASSSTQQLGKQVESNFEIIPSLP